MKTKLLKRMRKCGKLFFNEKKNKYMVIFKQYDHSDPFGSVRELEPEIHEFDSLKEALKCYHDTMREYWIYKDLIIKSIDSKLIRIA